MIIVEQDMSGNLICSFKYYPDYISRMKSVGGRFDPGTKKWTVSLNKYSDLLKTFKGELMFKTPQWEIEGKEPPDYSYLYELDNPIDVEKLGFKLKPFKYQDFGIKFTVDRLLKYGMSFIADDVGLGKTLMAIGAIKYMTDNNNAKRIVIMCKKSIKTQWASEIKKFVDMNADVYIADKSKSKRDKVYEEIDNNKNNTILIVNYHLLLNDADKVKADMVVLDECHTVKKYNGELNKACRKVAKKSKYCLFMTGTPIMNNPEDIYGIISIKDQKYFGSHKEFKKKYITEYYNGKFASVVGYKCLDELREQIQALIIRRTEKEVAIELPDVTVINKYCEIDETQRKGIEKANELSQEVNKRIGDLKRKYTTESDKDKKQELYTKILQLNESLKGFIAVEQIIANSPVMLGMSKSKAISKQYEEVIPDDKYRSSKMEMLLDLISDIVEAGKKVVCFSKYETVVNYVSTLLDKAKIKNVTYSGGLTDDERENAISSFQNDDDMQVLIGTDSLAEGNNLQIANNLINIDLPYNVATFRQRSGRIRRAGSKYSKAFVYNLLTEESIDINIYRKVIETGEVFDGLISADKAQSELLKKLNN